jgi:hypothetical protein
MYIILQLEDTLKNTTIVYPVHRWVREENPIIIYPHDTSLPQDDKQKEARKAEVERKKNEYIYKHTVPNGPPQVNQMFPLIIYFSHNYL